MWRISCCMLPPSPPLPIPLNQRPGLLIASPSMKERIPAALHTPATLVHTSRLRSTAVSYKQHTSPAPTLLHLIPYTLPCTPVPSSTCALRAPARHRRTSSAAPQPPRAVQITYNLTVPVSEKALALQVTLEPILGNPDMILFLVDTFGPQAIGDNSLRYAGREVVTVDSSFLPPGVMIAIVVHAQHTRASFDLTVDLFEEGRQVSQRDAKVTPPLLFGAA